ncbi:HAD family phosphatase [Patescibacteria group bacterium]|nr:HAD family phosphatase [Patescibacteria group bacterium]
MIDTIIFDLEGIVVDTESLWDKDAEIFLKRRGFVYEREKSKHLITGTSLEEGVEIMKKIYGFDGDKHQLALERIAIVKELFKQEIKFIPGFEDFLDKVKNIYKVCIATGLIKELFEIIDEKLKISNLFNDHVYSISDVKRVGKPSPDIFLYAAKKLNSKPQNCLVIEDSPNGIEAAQRAGMKCLVITTTYRRDKLQKSDYLVDSFEEIDLSKIK